MRSCTRTCENWFFDDQINLRGQPMAPNPYFHCRAIRGLKVCLRIVVNKGGGYNDAHFVSDPLRIKSD